MSTMFRSEEAVKNNDDCYFYYYSTCKKGDSCLFRHCEAALGTEIVCAEWQVGKCFRPSCSYRHMESNKDRSAIPCYWENQPGGCRKPHCVFRHYKKETIENAIAKKENLILPVSQNDWQPEGNQSPGFNRNANAINRPVAQVDNEEEMETTLLLPPAVEPLVVSFDGESDSESCTSTPVKPPVVERKVQFKSDERSVEPLTLKTKKNKEPTQNLDFGIKTLQQIREEKLEKAGEELTETEAVETEVKELFAEKKLNPRKKRCKRKIQLNAPASNEDLDFKIKTLDEIRKERDCQAETNGTQLQEQFTDAKENHENRNQRRHVIIRRDKQVTPSDSEKKNLVLSKSQGENNANEKPTKEKAWNKQKRMAREIYQPPKSQKQEEIKSISPNRNTEKNESYDNICIKTLAEIREERRLKQLQETDGDNASLQSSPSSLYDVKMTTEAEEPSSRKHKNESNLSVSTNKRIKLNTSKFSSKRNSSSPNTEANKGKSSGGKRKILTEDSTQPALVLNNTGTNSASDQQPTKLSKDSSSVVVKRRKVEILSSKESESRVPKSSGNNAQESSTHPASIVVEDEFDLFLDEDNDVDLNVPDVKDDDLLLEIDEMINS